MELNFNHKASNVNAGVPVEKILLAADPVMKMPA